MQHSTFCLSIPDDIQLSEKFFSKTPPLPPLPPKVFEAAVTIVGEERRECRKGWKRNQSSRALQAQTEASG